MCTCAQIYLSHRVYDNVSAYEEDRKRERERERDLALPRGTRPLLLSLR